MLTFSPSVFSSNHIKPVVFSCKGWRDYKSMKLMPIWQWVQKPNNCMVCHLYTWYKYVNCNFAFYCCFMYGNVEVVLENWENATVVLRISPDKPKRSDNV